MPNPDYVVLPDVGRISREQLRVFGPGQAESPSEARRGRVRAATLRTSSSTGSLGNGNPTRASARRWISAHVTGDGLSVGGSAIARPSESVDFAQLVGGRERQLREALRLPPTVRPINVHVRVTEASTPPSGSSASTGALGIRRLVARGSGAVAVRQQRDREPRPREVSLPEVPLRAPSREASATAAQEAPVFEPPEGPRRLRQRLEEQEQRLQEQLLEQAELQRQLQEHLEQEQQLQRELREQLERDLEDLSQLEGLVQGVPSLPATQEVGEVPAPVTRSASPVVEVPGVGPMHRRQLANLEALLNGADELATGADPDLPDLSNLSSTQLEQLEAQLSRGLDELTVPNPAPESSEGAQRGPEDAAQEQVPRPPSQAAESEVAPAGPAAELPSHMEAAPRGNPQVLSHEAAMPARRPPELMSREAAVSTSTTAWRVKEAGFQALLVKAVPKAECSICCDWLEEEDVVVLPCQARGCGSYFHARCIRPWLERNPSCPLCRESVVDLVRPATPPLTAPATGHPLLDLWFLAMAMQRQERENQMRTRQASPLAELPGEWDSQLPIRSRQTGSPSLADLQGVVFTASALVELLGHRLGFTAELPGSDVDEGGQHLDSALQAMLSGSDNAAQAREALPTSTGVPLLRPVSSFQEQILRSAASIDAVQSSAEQSPTIQRP
mmetsp:Transcript_66865/g.157548  ORF Transcript_66865/g.157548 Transcript_66865/m.157548 type:complete len:674 (+) Transcript_66865:58-2079(+)